MAAPARERSRHHLVVLGCITAGGVLARLAGVGTAWAVAGVVLAVLIWVGIQFSRRTGLPAWIADSLDGADAADLRVLSKATAVYRYVDYFNAAGRWAESQGADRVLDANHVGSLEQLLSGVVQPHQPPDIVQPPSIPFPVGPGEQAYLPTARFWVRGGDDPCVIRVSINHQVILEVATPARDRSTEVIDSIVADSLSGSIFKGEVVSVRVGGGVAMEDDHYGLGPHSPVSLSFSDVPAVREEDIVLDPEVRAVLHRNVVDLQNRREELREHGVPLRRGVLLYGPPGTGKTFACRYLYGQLEGTTVLTAAGMALVKVEELFELARGLAPTLVILEDVDLVFQSRDLNVYGASLGSLMDELDGLGASDEVCVLMTTNAIERLEAAIKDRPGRISQAVYFGPPTTELRRRYLERYLRDRPNHEVDLGHLVEVSDGVSHAFLSEWVHRAVQIAVEQKNGKLALTTDCFDAALDEMKRFSEGADRIIGFRTGF